MEFKEDDVKGSGKLSDTFHNQGEGQSGLMRRGTKGRRNPSRGKRTTSVRGERRSTRRGSRK